MIHDTNYEIAGKKDNFLLENPSNISPVGYSKMVPNIDRIPMRALKNIKITKLKIFFILKILIFNSHL